MPIPSHEDILKGLSNPLVEDEIKNDTEVSQIPSNEDIVTSLSQSDTSIPQVTAPKKSGGFLSEIGRAVDIIKIGFKNIPQQIKVTGGIVLQKLAGLDKMIFPEGRQVGNIPKELYTAGREKQIAFGEEKVKEGAEGLKAISEERAKLGQREGTAGFIDQVTYNAPSMATSLGLGVITSIVTANPAIGIMLGLSSSFSQTVGDTYADAKNNGADEKLAQNVSLTAGVFISAIEQLPLGRLLSKSPEGEIVKKTLMKNISKIVISTGKQSLLEGGTEGVQQIIQNALAKTYDEKRDLGAGFWDSVGVGAFLGAGADITVTGLDSALKITQGKKSIKQVTTDIEEAVNTPVEKRTDQQKEIASIIEKQGIELPTHEDIVAKVEENPVKTQPPVEGGVPKYRISGNIGIGNREISVSEEIGSPQTHIPWNDIKGGGELRKAQLEYEDSKGTGIENVKIAKDNFQKVYSDVVEQNPILQKYAVIDERYKPAPSVVEGGVSSGETFYHGASSNAVKNIKSKGFEIVDKGMNAGNGISLSTKPDVADLFSKKSGAGGEVLSVNLDKGTKLVSSQDFIDVKNSIAEKSGWETATKKATDFFKAKGYDGVDFRGGGLIPDAMRSEVRIWNPEKIKISKPSPSVVEGGVSKIQKSKLEVRGKPVIGTDAGNDNLRLYLDEINSTQISERIGTEKIKKTVGNIDITKGSYGGGRYLYRNDNGKIIGALQFVGDKKRGYVLSNIYVNPSNRLKGIATKLVETAKSDMPSLQVDSSLTKMGADFFRVKPIEIKTEKKGQPIEKNDPLIDKNNKDIKRLNTLYKGNKKFQSGDVETIRSTRYKPLVDKVVENVKSANPDMNLTDSQAYELAVNKIKTIEKTTKTQPVKQPESVKFKSRVFERLQQEHPELKGDLIVSRVDMENDAQKAVDLIVKDKQKAYDIATGKEISNDVTSTAVNIAMAEKALDDGNIKMYKKLIETRSLAQTRRGQEIVSERGSIKNNSTSRYVKELIATRLDTLGKKYLSDISEKISNKERATTKIDQEVSKIESDIKKKKLDAKTAMELLDSLTCII